MLKITQVQIKPPQRDQINKFAEKYEAKTWGYNRDPYMKTKNAF